MPSERSPGRRRHRGHPPGRQPDPIWYKLTDPCAVQLLDLAWCLSGTTPAVSGPTGDQRPGPRRGRAGVNRYRVARGCLDCAGRRSVYPINPMAVARYRDRHSTAGRKSDPRLRQSQSRAAPACKSQRLATAGYNWAFSAISAAPGARAHYDRRKADGTARRRPAQPLRAAPRLPAPLPGHQPALRRKHRLPQPHPGDTRLRSLTTNRIGCLRRSLLHPPAQLRPRTATTAASPDTVSAIA